jgi:hypothetical protein
MRRCLEGGCHLPSPPRSRYQADASYFMNVMPPSTCCHDNPSQGSVSIVAEPCSHPGSTKAHSCITVRYQRTIRVGRAQMAGRIQELNLPSHDWFHAISRESYTYSGTSCFAETCNDNDCQNYYAIASSRSHFETAEVELSWHWWPADVGLSWGWSLTDTWGVKSW